MSVEYGGPDRRRGGPDRRAPGETTRILIVDDHALFRVGDRRDPRTRAGHRGRRRGGRRAQRRRSRPRDLARHRPDGPVAAGARRHRDDAAHQARAAGAGIIVLAVNEDEDALFDAIKAGAAAFILKDVGPDDLVTIIRRVALGEFLINDKVFAKPAVASRVLKEFRELAVYGQEAAPIFAPLSPREVEILDNIAQGMTNKQVAYALSISEQTVKNHMSSILRKLSVNDRTQAVVYAMRQGWIRMPED